MTYTDGVLDEVRIAATARSASWIQTEYNNQSSPSTFMSYTVEEDLNRGAQTADRADKLSDSRPSQPSNHTLTFTVNHAIEASTTLAFTWPDGFSFTNSPSWYDSPWGYRRKITIDSTKIAGSEDLDNFPVLVSSTLAVWSTTSWGGYVQSATGWDFVFTASDGTTKLDHEIEKFASTTGELVAWVRLPALQRDTVNEFYVYYGGPTATDQQNKTGVWDANYKGVWHLTTTSSQTTLTLDSTANSNTGTKVSAMEPFSSSTGTIDGAQDFDGSDDSINAGSGSSLADIQNQGGGGMTVAFWIKPDSNTTKYIIVKGYASANSGSWYIRKTSNTNPARLEFWKEGATDAQKNYNNLLETGVWQHIVLTWDGSMTFSTGVLVYKDGSLIANTSATNGSSANSEASRTLCIGNRETIVPDGTCINTDSADMSLDEVRISNVARSASWIQTEYNNQSSPSTFYTISEEYDPTFDCRDVDIATGTEFLLGDAGDCWGTATHWGVTFATSSRRMTITSPSGTTPFTYVATGTEITVKIGTNATYQAQGDSRIVNPSSAGTFRMTLGGTAGSSGDFLVAITQGQTVSAEVAESLALTVSSVLAVNCTADDGASVTAKVTASTTIAFGEISANSFYIACQDLVVSTNAGGGYSLTSQENRPLMTTSNRTIPDTTCNAGTCSESTAAAWTTNTVNGFGHTCRNQSNSDCNAAYSNGSNFRQFADISLGETPQAIMSSTTPAIATGRVKYRLSRGSAQPAGEYTNIIRYIITATY